MKKKTKGAWEIHVREVDAGQDINTEHGRCSCLSAMAYPIMRSSKKNCQEKRGIEYGLV